ncbi:MAG: hypothetical protein HND50_04525 [Calditrichaeota bacterium]|nr:hypothetical protein [Calditrichota bacterium]
MAKYLRYAIGEILLVVIGILIALQINNWNESRKDRIKENSILNQLLIEFKSNLDQLDNKIFIREEIVKSASNILQYIDSPKKNKDSTDFHIAVTIGYATFDPIVNDLAKSGNLRLIKSDSLKQLLSFWTSEVVQITESEETWKKYRDEVYLPFLIEHYQLRTGRNKLIKSNYLKKFQIDKKAVSPLFKSGIGNTKHNEDFTRLLLHPDYEDHLVRCIITNNIANVQSVILRKRIVEILDLLDIEIKENE